MTIANQCAWCGSYPTPEDMAAAVEGAPVSHGICEPCAECFNQAPPEHSAHPARRQGMAKATERPMAMRTAVSASIHIGEDVEVYMSRPGHIVVSCGGYATIFVGREVAPVLYDRLLPMAMTGDDAA